MTTTELFQKILNKENDDLVKKFLRQYQTNKETNLRGHEWHIDNRYNEGLDDGQFIDFDNEF